MTAESLRKSLEDNITAGEKKKMKDLTLTHDRGSSGNPFDDAEKVKSAEFYFAKEVLLNLKARMKDPSKHRKARNLDDHYPREEYGSSEAISKSLRYFSVRNRSDGTQFSEEREITLKRSLYDASRKLDLSSEEDRLKTYEKWKFDHIISREELAARGFAYLGDGDRVQCVFCKGVLRDWRPGDEALKEHHKHFPTCPFILRLDVGNVPLDPPYSHVSYSVKCSEASPKSYEPSLSNHDVTASLTILDRQLCRLNIRHLQYQTLSSRIATFQNDDGILPSWPVLGAALAGFFHDQVESMDVDVNADENTMDVSEEEDELRNVFVRCYACDVRFNFKKVTPNEPPAWWEFHARQSRFCAHVKMHCGEEFTKRFSQMNVSAINVIPQSVGNRRHRVEPREVRARLDLPLYAELQVLLCPKLETMAQARELLSYLIDQRLEITGQDFDSIYDAYVQMHAYEVEFNKEKAEFPEQTMTKFLNLKKEELERQREELKLRSNRAQESIERGFLESQNPLSGMNDEQLSEFNRQLKDNRTCKICMDHIVNTVFLPCGHLVTCHECAPKVKNCPVCRLPITSTVLTSL